MERPDLTNADPLITDYIIYLEEQLDLSKGKNKNVGLLDEPEEITLPAESPTTTNIITISRQNIGKRTPRHLFSRQHRGGMGVFDLDVSKEDYPAILAVGEESQNLLLFSNLARVYRYPLSKLPASPVRSKGQELLERLPIEPDEKIVAALPEKASGYVALVSVTGRVRCFRHHFFGEHLRLGTTLYPYSNFGFLSAVCWTPGDADLFIVTRKGLAIRFSEKLISPQGDWGIKLAEDDSIIAITVVYPDSGVCLIGADGKGTVREMSGFAANKSPGGLGKIAIKNNQLVCATSFNRNDDLFILTRLGKIIRFPAIEIPTTEGVIQGVNCITMRGDEVITILNSGLNDLDKRMTE